MDVARQMIDCSGDIESALPLLQGPARPRIDRNPLHFWSIPVQIAYSLDSLFSPY